MYSGGLGAYHLGRIAARDEPSTLVDREIPVLTWPEGEDIVVAPLQALDTGTFGLATPELGLVAELAVDASLLPVLRRAWPPPDEVFGTGSAVYCGEAAAAVEAGPVELAPAGVSASVRLGLDETLAFSDACVRITPDVEPHAGVPLLPPALVGGAQLEPRVVVVTRDEGGEATGCAENELALGTACGVVDDDRVQIRAPLAPAFVAVESPERLLGAVDPSHSLVLRGFAPASKARVVGLAFDVRGESHRFDVDVVTADVRAHVVLNEVFADPRGAEAAGEWIELFNDGTAPVELLDFTLDDGVESTALPAFTLATGAYALLVSEAYDPDPELDTVAPSDTPILRVSRLGRSGLANAGELLRLRDPSGAVVSRFPALAAKAPGVSAARRSPDAPDEAASFGPHGAPGASPGRPNVVEEP
jgi:hypothetical protein